MAKKPQLKLTLVRSRFGILPKHAQTLKGLGLSRMHQAVVREDTNNIRGMIKQVSYLLNVEECK